MLLQSETSLIKTYNFSQPCSKVEHKKEFLGVKLQVGHYVDNLLRNELLSNDMNN